MQTMSKLYYIGNNLFDEFEQSTMQDCIEYCSAQSVLGLDIETGRKYARNTYDERVYKPGLDPYVSRVVMIQIGTLEKRFVIDARVMDYSGLKSILENPDILKVGHNLKFEGKFFYHQGIRIVNVWDTMLAEKVLYNGYQHSYSLEALMSRYLGVKSVQSLNLFGDVSSHRDFNSMVRNKLDSYFLSGTPIDEEAVVEEVEQELLSNQYIDKSTRLGFIELGDSPFTTKMIKYGEEDIVAPLKIYEIQSKGRYVNGELYRPDIGFLLENKVTQVLAEAEYHGVPFDSSKWLEAYELAKTNYIARKAKLDNYVVNNVPEFCGTIDLFNDKPSCIVKWSSSTQVVKLFKHLGICPQERSKSTKKIEYTVGAKTLFRQLPNELKSNFFKSKDLDIIDYDTLKLQYLLFKKSEQLCTTFGKDWLKYVHPITKRVHTNYNQYMISGRLSSSRPNCQQIPNLEQYRKAFAGNLINSDYSSQELRIAAEVHKVQKMMDFFVYGDKTFKEDLHSFNATQMFRVIYNDPDLIINKKDYPDERDVAKSLGFKLNYGGSSYTISMDLGISIEDAENYVVNYFKGLPGMEESFKVKKKEALQRGWIELDSYTGKRYFFPYHNKMEQLKQQAYELTDYPQGVKIPDEEKQRLKSETNWSKIWKEYMYYKGKFERRALNIPIQGAAATMMKLAGILLYNYRHNNNCADVFKIPLYIHDELLAEIKTNNDEYAKIIEQCMQEAGSYLCQTVPMPAQAVQSTFWEH